MDYLILALAGIIGYIMGAIPFGFLFVKITKGIDLRDVGSGRTGGTNSFRAAGLGVGFFTFIMDIVKGAAAVWLVRLLLGASLPEAWLPWSEALAGAAAVIGHNWSVFLKFGGGAGTGPNVGWATAIWWPVMIVSLIIGGLTLYGIGMACHLQRRCPGKSYVILEARNAMGGTWDLFRYPGIRADSDMYTLAYNFRPWDGEKTIADGPSILKYLRETAAEYGVERQIRYGHSVVRASWSTKDAHWMIEARDAATGQQVEFVCNMLLMCAGYYSYESGYTPEFRGCESFQGQIVIRRGSGAVVGCCTVALGVASIA